MKRWLACVGPLAAGLLVLHRLGPRLATPSGDADEVLVAMNVLRLAAMVAGGWLLAVAVLDGIAQVAGIRPLRRVTHRLTPSSFRRLLGTSAGAGMASMVAFGVLGPPPVVQPVSDSDVSIVMRQLPDDDPNSTATMHVVEDAPVPIVAAAPMPADDTWVVEPGESFWAIAVAHMTDGLGREPTNAEVVAYWTVLIEANRADLPDPANPDLLFAGQVLTLPAV